MRIAGLRDLVFLFRRLLDRLAGKTRVGQSTSGPGQDAAAKPVLDPRGTVIAVDAAVSRRTFPGFDQAFYLGDGSSNRAYRGRFQLSVDAFALTRAEQTVTAAVEVRHEMGGKIPSDVVWTTSAVPLIVSDRVIEVLTKCRFTGWSTYPVKLIHGSGDEVAGYQGLAIHVNGNSILTHVGG